ncbi:hypothetical protein EJ04DRAFT_563825 [Polyplosphaeria fusca]|uniref:Nephrocystin 3-like N-terminal domain-containing protein n=1 Tax=Polyplosphaeria fusca TaxID=682080 RepID=A0A9P4R1I2_9PLEO|nr:hypothetical protein EJ04DRAFT_563825 [Polyplosphaeria fusca]
MHQRVDEDFKMLQRNQRLWSDLTRLALSAEQARTTVLQRSILVSLDYNIRTARQYAIKEAHARTFEWASIDPSQGGQTTFKDWLLNGNGVYFVSGKPGSGKSTLMKYIAEHKETNAALQQWSNGNRLVTASFYFWNAGTPMQRSLDGLLRSILIQVLEQCPELMPTLFPDRWDNLLSAGIYNFSLAPWTIPELKSALQAIAGKTLSSKFALFIDGLDEYDGTDREIVEYINELANSADIKLCLSSRPHVDFIKAYGHNKDRIMFVSDLTMEDIKIYVRDRLGENEAFKTIKLQHPERYQHLKDEIVVHAKGVFL